jgi:serine/threonine protein kinase
VGLELSETPRDISFCAHAILGQAPLIVPDTQKDERFASNPLVVDDPNIRFYAGVPIFVDPGSAVGSLCVLDRVAREIAPDQLDALRALARRVEVELRLRRDHTTAAGMDVPAPGTRLLDRYVVGEVLGAGGMGVVVAATDARTGGPVAIKFLVLHGARGARGEEATERFAREAKALLRIDSARVARIFDVGNLEGGAPFIVMERLEGEDLHALAGRGRLAIQDAVDIVLQACEGIATAHALGIIHRDVKPGNLFVTRAPDGAMAIKVLDFGISKLVSATREGDDVQLTGATGVVGSPQYMSPEQMLCSRDVDGRSDVWSLGVILYELVTGRVPFEGTGIAEICAKVFTEDPLAPHHLRAEIPGGLEEVILHCLTRGPEERCPSVRALALALAPFASAAQRRVSERVARLPSPGTFET